MQTREARSALGGPSRKIAVLASATPDAIAKRVCGAPVVPNPLFWRGVRPARSCGETAVPDGWALWLKRAVGGVPLGRIGGHRGRREAAFSGEVGRDGAGVGRRLRAAGPAVRCRGHGCRAGGRVRGSERGAPPRRTAGKRTGEPTRWVWQASTRAAKSQVHLPFLHPTRFHIRSLPLHLPTNPSRLAKVSPAGAALTALSCSCSRSRD